MEGGGNMKTDGGRPPTDGTLSASTDPQQRCKNNLKERAATRKARATQHGGKGEQQ